MIKVSKYTVDALLPHFSHLAMTMSNVVPIEGQSEVKFGYGPFIDDGGHEMTCDISYAPISDTITVIANMKGIVPEIQKRLYISPSRFRNIDPNIAKAELAGSFLSPLVEYLAPFNR